MPFRVIEIFWTTEGTQGEEVLSFAWENQGRLHSRGDI